MSASLLTRRHFLSLSAALAASTALMQIPSADAQSGSKRLIVAADSEPKNLNPAIVASNGVFFISSKVIEPLAEASYKGKDGLEPKLALEWAGSDDGLSATFKLRPDVKWHDGKPFTSQDVAFSALNVWKELQNLGRLVFANLKAVDTPDDLTAIFRFSKPTPFQLIRNALPAITAVLPKHLYDGTDIATNPYNNKPVGTGPFVFAEYKPGEYYRLTKNPNYWERNAPALDEIIYKILPDRSAAASALEAEEIHLAAFSAVPLAELNRISQVPGLKVVADGYDALTYQLIIEINHRRKELSNVRVRQAIAHAINRKQVIDTVFLGYATESTGPVPKNAPEFYSSNVQTYDYDIAKANALLDEAGYKKKADGTRFELNLLPAPYFNETKQFGAYLRQALASIGIVATIVNNDSAAHQKAVYTDHNFDLAIAPTVFRGDPAISTTILARSGTPAGVGFSNQGGYVNEALDRLIDRAAETIDTATRTQLYAEFQKEVTKDLPFINVAEWGFISVARDNVMNIANNPRWAVSNWHDTALRP